LLKPFEKALQFLSSSVRIFYEKQLDKKFIIRSLPLLFARFNARSLINVPFFQFFPVNPSYNNDTIRYNTFVTGVQQFWLRVLQFPPTGKVDRVV
jgi:hypothetical protein